MKNLIKVLFLFSSALLLNSCGPTGCECLRNQRQLYNLGITKDCVDKFGADIPDNLRGTDEFARQLKKNYEDDCDE